MIAKDEILLHQKQANGWDVFRPEVESLCLMAGLEDCCYLEEISRGVAQFTVDRFKDKWIEKGALASLTADAFAAVGCSEESDRLKIYGKGGAKFWSCSLLDDGVVVLIDLERLVSCSGCMLELMLAQLLLRSIDSFCSLWDHEGGKGALILKNLRRIAMLFESGGRREIESRASDIKLLCERRLVLRGKALNWTDFPVVMRADI